MPKKGAVFYTKLNKRSIKTQQYSLPKVDNHRDLPSCNSTQHSTAKKEGNQYTGDFVIGIIGTHKSNDQPVTSKQAAIDASTMRRNHYGGS